ncbi:PqiB family protein [Aliagarivorans taiwanensis]|uniref:PqiB family protein n=1 Tax=Aliagarivorans taiwanensis TaxID=561966 RepID=UPI00042659E6|nr:MlaD family protein [Aliagarivorans taiwanensis]
MSQQAVTRKERIISPIWLLPIIALGMAIWLLYKTWSEAGVPITIDFASAQGIVAGQTHIYYQGLDIGVVTKVNLNESLTGVQLEAEIDRDAEQLLTENSIFWLVSPKASLTEISGLDALVGGNYIELQYNEGEPALSFVAVPEPPTRIDGKGLLLHLRADELGSLDVGSPIYFKKIPVGEVKRYQLDDDHSVVMDLLVKPEYAHLVKDHSRFWDVSGIDADISLQGMRLQSESLASLIHGGVAFDSPEQGLQARAGQHFTLFEGRDAATRLSRVSVTTDTVEGLNVDRTRLRYKGAEVGLLRQIDYQQDHYLLSFSVNSEYISLFKEDTELRRLQPEIGLEGLKHLEGLLGSIDIGVYPGAGAAAQSFTLSSAKQAPPGAQTLVLNASLLHGIEASSVVIYRGFPVGGILDIRLDGNEFDIEIYLEKPYLSLLNDKSYFHIVSPLEVEASLFGLDISSGGIRSFIASPIALDYMESTPASAEQRLFASKHDAREHQRPTSAPKRLNLRTERLGSLSVGSPVYFKQLQVGEVIAYQLTSQQDVSIDIDIYGEHRALITDYSRFWHASGVNLEINSSGVSLQSESLRSIALGGIAFENLEQLPKQTRPRLYSSKEDALQRRLNVTLLAEHVQGLKPGAAIRYLGKQIGQLKQVHLAEDLSHFELGAELYHPYSKHFAREQSRYWLESTELSLDGAKNLGNLITGNYIEARPGQGRPIQQFELSPHPPRYSEDALLISVKAVHLASVDADSPLLYKQQTVGRILGTRVINDGSGIIADVMVEPEYRHLVRANSVFWQASGVDFSLGFGGADLHMDSLETLVKGGLAFATPESIPFADAVTAGFEFTLSPTFDKTWLKWSPSIPNQ